MSLLNIHNTPLFTLPPWTFCNLCVTQTTAKTTNTYLTRLPLPLSLLSFILNVSRLGLITKISKRLFQRLILSPTSFFQEKNKNRETVWFCNFLLPFRRCRPLWQIEPYMVRLFQNSCKPSKISNTYRFQGKDSPHHKARNQNLAQTSPQRQQDLCWSSFSPTTIKEDCGVWVYTGWQGMAIEKFSRFYSHRSGLCTTGAYGFENC